MARCTWRFLVVTVIICLAGWGFTAQAGLAADGPQSPPVADAPAAPPAPEAAPATDATPAAPATDATPAAPAPDATPAAPLPAADGGGRLRVEAMWIVCGARQYYLAFGRWPQSWREVVQSGLFQAPLVAADGHEADPDSSAPLSAGEARYLPPAKAGDAAQVGTLADPQAGEQRIALETPLSYKDMFNAMYLLQEDSTVAKQMQEYFNAVLADDKRVLQFAMGGMLEQGLKLYKAVHGDYPPDWAAYIASGLSPVGAGAVNPATGKPLNGDGSAWDYSYKYYPPGAGETQGKYYFSHIDADGTAPKFPVLY